MNSEPINWSLIQHTVGDMHDGEEFAPVRVRLPDGRILSATGITIALPHGFYVIDVGDSPVVATTLT